MDISQKSVMSEEWCRKCEQLFENATEAKVDTVYPINFGEMGYTKRWRHFSVYTNTIDSWCKFSRVIVTFDTESGRWHCPCRTNRQSHRCIHRMMAIWWVFQEAPQLLSMEPDNEDSIQDLDTEVHMLQTESKAYTDTQKKASMMTEYLYKKKRIPLPQDIPLDLKTNEIEPPPCFVPEESSCPYCPGPTPPDLSDPEIITEHATVYGHRYVKKGKYSFCCYQ